MWREQPQDLKNTPEKKQLELSSFLIPGLGAKPTFQLLVDLVDQANN